eukprot:2516315-Heterocapsa_arctica.AAC.1
MVDTPVDKLTAEIERRKQLTQDGPPELIVESGQRFVLTPWDTPVGSTAGTPRGTSAEPTTQKLRNSYPEIAP